MKSAKCIRRRRTINRTISHNLQKKENEQTKNQIQTKLNIGKPGDKYEQETDSVADQVMRMPDPVSNLQRQCESCEEEESIQTKPIAASISPWIQTQAVEEEEEEMLQPKWIQKAGCSTCEEQEIPEVQTIQMSPLSHIESCSGQALPDSSRGFFEPRFGHSFSNVKVHTCDSALQMNQQLRAQAFTYGNNIFFNEGKYNPGSSDGKKLLAHELTHVVQQNGKGNKYTAVSNKIAQPIIQRAIQIPVGAIAGLAWRAFLACLSGAAFGVSWDVAKRYGKAWWNKQTIKWNTCEQVISGVIDCIAGIPAGPISTMSTKIIGVNSVKKVGAKVIRKFLAWVMSMYPTYPISLMWKHLIGLGCIDESAEDSATGILEKTGGIFENYKTRKGILDKTGGIFENYETREGILDKTRGLF